VQRGDRMFSTSHAASGATRRRKTAASAQFLQGWQGPASLSARKNFSPGGGGGSLLTLTLAPTRYRWMSAIARTSCGRAHNVLVWVPRAARLDGDPSSSPRPAQTRSASPPIHRKDRCVVMSAGSHGAYSKTAKRLRGLLGGHAAREVERTRKAIGRVHQEGAQVRAAGHSVDQRQGQRRFDSWLRTRASGKPFPGGRANIRESRVGTGGPLAPAQGYTPPWTRASCGCARSDPGRQRRPTSCRRAGQPSS